MHIPSGVGRPGHLGIKDPKTIYIVEVRRQAAASWIRNMHARYTGVPGHLAYM